MSADPDFQADYETQVVELKKAKDEQDLAGEISCTALAGTRDRRSRYGVLT